jgi:poly-gamma-glutamate capsule biosynthesis protein CapA/YwtB (metallophosphatase superfamily)
VASRSGGRRTAVLVGALAALLVGAGTAGAAVVLNRSGSSTPAFVTPSGATGASSTAAGASAEAAAAQDVSMSATGDIIMGSAPNGLPPGGGKGFFDPVKNALVADLQMGNLEQTITDDTGVGKCSAASAGATCFAYRTPPSYAANLKDGGFMLMNQANNHAYDFGPAGYKNTQKNLDAVGIKYTGGPGVITISEVKGVKIAVVGFSPYPWSNLCTDLDKARSVVRAADDRADLVVVQVHQGGEGADKNHVKPGTEYYLGENRCDPIAFGHAVIDAGADLVIGHGPHVVRAMEFYKGHLIAYSIGNLAGYRALNYRGVLAVGAILKVTLGADGSWKRGSIVPTAMVAPGVPRLDPKKQAISMINQLSRSDFPGSGAKIAADGSITA